MSRREKLVTVTAAPGSEGAEVAEYIDFVLNELHRPKTRAAIDDAARAGVSHLVKFGNNHEAGPVMVINPDGSVVEKVSSDDVGEPGGGGHTVTAVTCLECQIDAADCICGIPSGPPTAEEWFETVSSIAAIIGAHRGADE